ncbi:hypothetical protein A0H76_1594 [Hepatospora eriocheir]|uniref:Uncharacterized protein n=1 Tax=Hepatospora eriocheir TaxID=1081669 RepID=A0A1X0QGT3_9MICR|nr:hypothetical protein A0H76_1594 [Hepatospora eriocheir]
MYFLILLLKCILGARAIRNKKPSYYKILNNGDIIRMDSTKRLNDDFFSNGVIISNESNSKSDLSTPEVDLNLIEEKILTLEKNTSSTSNDLIELFKPIKFYTEKDSIELKKEIEKFLESYKLEIANILDQTLLIELPEKIIDQEDNKDIIDLIEKERKLVNDYVKEFIQLTKESLNEIFDNLDINVFNINKKIFEKTLAIKLDSTFNICIGKLKENMTLLFTKLHGNINESEISQASELTNFLIKITNSDVNYINSIIEDIQYEFDKVKKEKMILLNNQYSDFIRKISLDINKFLESLKGNLGIEDVDVNNEEEDSKLIQSSDE